MARHPMWYCSTLLVMAAVALSPLWTGVAAGVADPPDDWSALKSGREVFEAACATCHGSRGTGADRAMRGFEVAPPNFTDCAFSSREPSIDWYGIAYSGGPTKGFSRLMPAFGQVLSKRQLEAAVEHVKSYCKERRRWPVGEFNVAKALNTGKAFPENEVAWEIGATVKEPVSINGKFVVARRIGARHQLEAALPVGVQQVARERADGETALDWSAGTGDLVVAWKSVLWHYLPAGTLGSVTLDVFFPTGDEGDDFSDGIFKFEPALAIVQLIPYLGFLQIQGGAELSTDTDKAPHAVFWRGALGHSFRRGGYGRPWSPIVELLGSMELDENRLINWDIVPQLQVALSRRLHVRFAAGVLVPVTEFKARQLELQAYLIWDWYDGGFAEGW